jgi:hypothetical protein
MRVGEKNMSTSFRTHIRKVFLKFKVYLRILAKQMNLTPVARILESHVSKVILPDGRDEFGLQAVVVPCSNNASIDSIFDKRSIYILGCSPTAANDILKTDEGSNLPNIYPGTLSPDGSWGIFTDNKDASYTIHPLTAAQITLEQVWDFYQSTAPEPVSGGQDLSIDQVGPLMPRSLYALGDFDHDGASCRNYDGEHHIFY